jgi:uncharacterized Zn finger protein (UPF0148 family)
MTGQSYQVNAVQCPNCGASLGDAKSGDTVSCNYCGATLQVSEGASGNPVAKLVSIADSTAFVAKTEALKRVQAQYEAIEDVILEFQNFSSWKDLKFDIKRWFKGVNINEPIYNWSTKQRYFKYVRDARERVESCERELEEKKKIPLVGLGSGSCLFFLIIWFLLLSRAFFTDIFPLTLSEFFYFLLLAVGPLILWYVLVLRVEVPSGKRARIAWAESHLAEAQQELAKLEVEWDECERGFLQWRKYMDELEAKRDHLKRRADELEADMDKLMGRL